MKLLSDSVICFNQISVHKSIIWEAVFAISPSLFPDIIEDITNHLMVSPFL